MKRMHRSLVALYNPEAVFYTMPLSLLAVASALDPRRFQVRIVDSRTEPDPLQSLSRVTTDALCLGVTVLSGAPIRDALKISRSVKESNPGLPVIWGGWHPSLFPLEVLSERAVDISVQGQGEVTFAELLDYLASGEDLAEVSGLSYRKAGTARSNPARPLVDMNSLPAANYELIPVEEYFRLKGSCQLDYISSIGCQFRCAFCADPFVFGRKWRALEPGRVGEEIQALWKRYRFTDLAFQDETFFTSRHRVQSIAEEFLKRDFSFTWTATIRADQGHRLSEEVFAECVRSGLRQVLLGVESGSQEMLNWMEKDITISQVFECAHLCKKYGVQAIFPFIVGFPGESFESIRASLNLIKELRSMSPGFQTPVFYFKPYPGSRITDDVVRAGHRLPETLEEWADFDYVGSAGPWVGADTYRLIERFKFYNRFAGGSSWWLRWPLQQISRWRCRNDFYSFPVEKAVVEKIRPQPELS